MGDASSLWCSVLWLLLLSLPAMATNSSAYVSLRIEGDTSTIFEGWINTTGHNVSTARGGNHTCDGTNNGTYPEAGPTPTSALDDAARQNDFDWDGPFYDNYSDYIIYRIKDTENTSTRSWGILVGYQFIQKGGCQVQVDDKADILFAYDAFRPNISFLNLSGPKIVRTYEPFQLTVIDGRGGDPVAGAVVTGGYTTDADGHVNITVTTAGDHPFKAEKPPSIRSNSVRVRAVNSQPVRVDSEK